MYIQKTAGKEKKKHCRLVTYASWEENFNKKKQRLIQRVLTINRQVSGSRILTFHQAIYIENLQEFKLRNLALLQWKVVESS